MRVIFTPSLGDPHDVTVTTQSLVLVDGQEGIDRCLLESGVYDGVGAWKVIDEVPEHSRKRVCKTNLQLPPRRRQDLLHRPAGACFVKSRKFHSCAVNVLNSFKDHFRPGLIN